MTLMTRLRADAFGLLAVVAISSSLPGALVAQTAPSQSGVQAPGSFKAGARPSRAKSPPAPKRDLYGDPLPTGAELRLGTTRYRQDSPIHRIAYTPDGKNIVTDGEDSILRVWDADEGRVIRRIDPEVGAMEDFALTEKGKLIMATGITLDPGGYVRHVTMTELDTGRVVDQGSWAVEEFGINPFALCPDRQLFAIGSDEGTVRILDAWNGAEICRFESGKREIVRVLFTRDGKRIAFESRTGPEKVGSEVRIYEVDSRKELRVIHQSGWNFEDLMFSPDGSTIAAAQNLELTAWIVDSGEPVSFRDALVDQIRFSRDGRTLTGIGSTGRLRVFDLAARRTVISGKLDVANLDTVALSPDDRVLVANAGPCVLHSWEIKGRRDRFSVPDAHTDSVVSVLCTPDGKTLITASKDRTIRLWDRATGKQIRVLKHSGSVELMDLSRDGRWLVAPVNVFNQIFIWDLQNGGGPIVLSARRDDSMASPCAVRMLDDGNTILMITGSGILTSWDLGQRRAREVAQPQFSPPDPPYERMGNHFTYAAIFLADGKKLLAKHVFSGLHGIDVPSGKELFRVAKSGGNFLVPSPDERILATAGSGEDSRRLTRAARVGPKTSTTGGITVRSTSGIITLLDSDTGKELRRITVAGSEVWAVAFSPDGKTLAATSGWETGQIHLYEVATGRELRTIETPALRSRALAFTPDGNQLVTGMADASVLVWDVGRNP